MEPTDSGTVIVRVGPTLDFRNAEAFKAGCQEQVRAGVRHFILDLSATDMLDSVGLGALFSIYRNISPEDGILAMVGVRDAVAVLVELTKVDQIFPQYQSVQDAVTALRASSL